MTRDANAPATLQIKSDKRVELPMQALPASIAKVLANTTANGKPITSREWSERGHQTPAELSRNLRNLEQLVRDFKVEVAVADERSKRAVALRLFEAIDPVVVALQAQETSLTLPQQRVLEALTTETLGVMRRTSELG